MGFKLRILIITSRIWLKLTKRFHIGRSRQKKVLSRRCQNISTKTFSRNASSNYPNSRTKSSPSGIRMDIPTSGSRRSGASDKKLFFSFLDKLRSFALFDPSLIYLFILRQGKDFMASLGIERGVGRCDDKYLWTWKHWLPTQNSFISCHFFLSLL